MRRIKQWLCRVQPIESKTVVREKAMDPTILERIKRNDELDQIEIGKIVERATIGDFGTVLKCLINAIIDEQIKASNNYKLSADRALGRIESMNLLQDRLDSCIDIKNQLTEEVRRQNAL